MVEIPPTEEESKAPNQVLRTTELNIEKNADVSANRPHHTSSPPHDSPLIGQKSIQWQVRRGEDPLLKHSLQAFDRCTDCGFITESCAENMEEASPAIQERVP